MSTESQLEQAERREVLENDKRVREQASTFLEQTHDDLGGRFTQISPMHVVGTTEKSPYPAASAAHQTELPPEPPLVYSVEKDHKLMGGGRA